MDPRAMKSTEDEPPPSFEDSMAAEVPVDTIGRPEQNYQVEEVLPTFEMHSDLLNRTVLSSETGPPSYGDSADGTRRASSSAEALNVGYAPDLYVLNHLNVLPRFEQPLKVQVCLTKRLPVMNVPTEREDPLREYGPGDLVTGYITIQNYGPEPIQFELFLVSLQGFVGVPRWHGSAYSGALSRTFLKTYDLSASYHLAFDSSDDIVRGLDHYGQVDSMDGTVYALPNDRIIKLGVVYKKFFRFVLPRYLLDNTCPYQLPPHLKLPPSFGVDTMWDNGRMLELESSKALGYERSGERGGPIKAIDFAACHEYVAYTINVQVLGVSETSTDTTKPQYGFNVLKDYANYFRVSTEQSLDVNTMGTTQAQLDVFDSEIRSSVNDLIPRLDARSDADVSVEFKEKAKQLANGLLSDSEKSPGPPQQLFTYDASGTAKVRSKRMLLFKSNGRLMFTAHAPRGLSLPAMKPNCFRGIPTQQPWEQSRRPSRRASSIGPSTIGSSTMASLSASMSTAATGCGSLEASDPILLDLEFVPSAPGGGGSRPPVEITVSLELRCIDIRSETPLPVTFDDRFVLKYCDNMGPINDKYSSIYRLVYDLSKETHGAMPKTVYDGIVSLSQMESSVHPLKSFFQKVTLKPEWHSNRANVEVPLRVSSVPVKGKYCIPPNFETCVLGRWYQVGLRVGGGNAVVLPITVV